MKLLLSLLLISNIALATPRLSIEGLKASRVIGILENYGLPAQSTDVGDFVSAKQIDCSNLACAVTGYTTTATIEGSDATTLSNLFLEAGAINQDNMLTIRTLDCIDWNVPAEQGEKQEVPTCLFR